MSGSDTSSQGGVDENVFIEQSEYISEPELMKWVQSHPSEKVFLKKLSSAGAKLIVGPRGCGKTTLLLKSYHELRQSNSNAFPVYVNFKTSLKLEPLYKNNVNASYWFNQWLILRTYQGIYETLASKRINDVPLYVQRGTLSKSVADLEAGKITAEDKAHEGLTVQKLQDDLTSILNRLDLTRAVLLLDDAAHAFSFAQQRGFFDYFREVKSRNIAPKAAIYPGVTSFSATFQAGHDAEEVDVWLKPDDPAYLPFMRDLVQKRFPHSIFQQLEQSGDAFSLVCYCAYGVPRALLNMLHELIGEEGPQTYKISARRAQQSIRKSLSSTLDIHLSLKLKLPIYGNFIDTGQTLLKSSSNLIKEYNRAKSVTRKSVSIAINAPLSTEMQKTLGFLEYAGLVVPKGSVSRGEKGAFQLYGIHYAYLVNDNSIIPKKSPGLGMIVQSLNTRHAHEFTRAQPKRLLAGTKGSSAFALMLPPCQVCGAVRINENAKFCHSCGSPLKNISVFEELVKQDISVLDLTTKRIATIKQHTDITKVKDILLDHDHKKLLSVPWIGPIWAKRIMSYAEEYIA
jgi:hypothetical protein